MAMAPAVRTAAEAAHRTVAVVGAGQHKQAEAERSPVAAVAARMQAAAALRRRAEERHKDWAAEAAEPPAATVTAMDRR